MNLRHDIHDFIPSPDIAEHCLKIGHVFSPTDMAIIVALSEKPLGEKHAAWQAIVDGYPDTPVCGNEWLEPKPSLHEYLVTRMAMGENPNEHEPIEFLFVDLPVPFKKGDILVMPDGKPGVLDHLTHWWKGDPFKYEDFVSGNKGGCAEMCASLYFIGSDNELTWDHTDSNSLYVLKYHQGELEGQHRFLAKVSSHVKRYSQSHSMRIDLILEEYRAFFMSE